MHPGRKERFFFSTFYLMTFYRSNFTFWSLCPWMSITYCCNQKWFSITSILFLFYKFVYSESLFMEVNENKIIKAVVPLFLKNSFKSYSKDPTSIYQHILNNNSKNPIKYSIFNQKLGKQYVFITFFLLSVDGVLSLILEVWLLEKGVSCMVEEWCQPCPCSISLCSQRTKERWVSGKYNLRGGRWGVAKGGKEVGWQWFRGLWSCDSAPHHGNQLFRWRVHMLECNPPCGTYSRYSI